MKWITFFLLFFILSFSTSSSTIHAQQPRTPAFPQQQVDLHIDLPVSFDSTSHELQAEITLKNTGDSDLSNIAISSDLLKTVSSSPVAATSQSLKFGAPFTYSVINTVLDKTKINVKSGETYKQHFKRNILDPTADATYSVRVFAVSSIGLPLGTQAFTLPSTVVPLTDTRVRVDDISLVDTSGHQLNAHKGLTSPNSVALHIGVNNVGSQPIDLIPSVQAYSISPYATKSPPLVVTASQPIHLVPSQKLPLNLALPKTLAPGTYSVVASFTAVNGIELLRSSPSTFIIAGESALIQNQSMTVGRNGVTRPNASTRVLVTFADPTTPTWNGLIKSRVEDSETHQVLSHYEQSFIVKNNQPNTDITFNQTLSNYLFSGRAVTGILEVYDQNGNLLDSSSTYLVVPAIKLSAGTAILWIQILSILAIITAILILRKRLGIGSRHVVMSIFILLILTNTTLKESSAYAATAYSKPYTSDTSDQQYYDFPNKFVRSNMGVGYGSFLASSSNSAQNQFSVARKDSTHPNDSDGVAIAKYSFALGWGADWKLNTNGQSTDYLDLQYPVPELGLPCILNGQELRTNNDQPDAINRGSNDLCVNDWAWKNYSVPNLIVNLDGDLMPCATNQALNNQIGGVSNIGNQTYSYGSSGSNASYTSNPVQVPLLDGFGTTVGYLTEDYVRNGTLNVWIASCVGSNNINPTLGKVNISLSMDTINNRNLSGHNPPLGAEHALSLISGWSSSQYNLGLDRDNGGRCDNGKWCPADTGGNSLIKPYDTQRLTIPSWYPPNMASVTNDPEWNIDTYKNEIISCQQFSFSDVNQPGSDAENPPSSLPNFATGIQNKQQSLGKSVDYLGAPMPSYSSTPGGTDRGQSLQSFDMQTRSSSCPTLNYPAYSSASVVLSAPASVASGSTGTLTWTDNANTAYIVLTGNGFDGVTHYPVNSSISTPPLTYTQGFIASPFTSYGVMGPTWFKSITVTSSGSTGSGATPSVSLSAPGVVYSGTQAPLSWSNNSAASYITLSGGQFDGTVHYPVNSGLTTIPLTSSTIYIATPYSAGGTAGTPSPKTVNVNVASIVPKPKLKLTTSAVSPISAGTTIPLTLVISDYPTATSSYVTLYQGGPIGCSWANGSGGTCLDTENPTIDTSYIYIGGACDSNGCLSSDTITVTVTAGSGPAGGGSSSFNYTLTANPPNVGNNGGAYILVAAPAPGTSSADSLTLKCSVFDTQHNVTLNNGIATYSGCTAPANLGSSPRQDTASVDAVLLTGNIHSTKTATVTVASPSAPIQASTIGRFCSGD